MNEVEYEFLRNQEQYSFILKKDTGEMSAGEIRFNFERMTIASKTVEFELRRRPKPCSLLAILTDDSATGELGNPGNLDISVIHGVQIGDSLSLNPNASDAPATSPSELHPSFHNTFSLLLPDKENNERPSSPNESDELQLLE